jgi:hypothetical protein
LKSLWIEDHTVINEEQRRRKRNFARLQKKEEEQRLIADGEGKISVSNQQDTNVSPVGPRKVKTTALKDASELVCSRNLYDYYKCVLAWYEAERKRGLAHPT